MTAIHDMSPRQLRAELAFAEGMMRRHREGLFGSCYNRICPEKWPCRVYQQAASDFRELTAALKRLEDLEETRYQTKLEWR